jgi:hypothetical protein
MKFKALYMQNLDPLKSLTINVVHFATPRDCVSCITVKDHMYHEEIMHHISSQMAENKPMLVNFNPSTNYTEKNPLEKPDD